MVDRRRMIRQMETIERARPHWCLDICQYALTDVCIEQCGVERDCGWFRLREDLVDLPPFPISEAPMMTALERWMVVVVHIQWLEREVHEGPTDCRHLKFDRERIDKVWDRRIRQWKQGYSK